MINNIIKIFRTAAVISLLLSQMVYGKETDNELPDDIDTLEEIDIKDSFEFINRDTYSFNKGVDKIFILPATKAYAKVTFTDFGRERVNDVLQNLYEPNRMINSIFYGKPAGFFTSALRFMINSTFGLLGLFDPATKLGVKKYDISFREVIAEKLCIKNGNYFVIPLLGPSTIRNATALGIDKFALDPFTFIFPLYASITRFGVEVIATRYDKSEVIDQISQASIDEYAMVRGLYYQSDKAKEFDECCIAEK